MPFDLGDTVPLGITVTNAAGTLVNATTVGLTITLPDGTTNFLAPTNPPAVTGQYIYDYTPNVAGRFGVSWVTTVPNTAYTDAFDVVGASPPLIFSLTDAKQFLNMQDTTADEELREYIEGVTAVVEAVVGPVVRRTVTTTLNGSSTVAAALPYLQVLSLTSAAYVADAVAIPVTNMVVEYGVLRDKTSAYLPSSPWTLTYVVGRTTIPANIRQGAKEILKQAWASQRGTDVPAFLVSYRAAAWLKPDSTPLGFS